jgi:hypothetical protein
VTDEYKDSIEVPIRDRGSAKIPIVTNAAREKEYVHGKNNGLSSLINKPLRIGARPSS